ncbi:MAG: hypothetical protein J2P32_00810 [Actinobacteria bacterium]|nr:hypothetical protein [Actinomycetota bacterium]
MAQQPSAPGRRLRLAAVIVTALAAAAAGAGIVAALHGLAGSGSAAATPGVSPSAPTNPGLAQPGGSGALPGGGSGGAGMRLLIAGRVTAVSGSSITIRGRGQPVTAAVTGSTRVTGKTSGIGGVRVGDQVSAQITQHGGRLTATAIQDPARLPGGLP